MVGADEDIMAVAVAYICSVDAGTQVGRSYLPTHHCNLTADEIADRIRISTNLFVYTHHDDALRTACLLRLLC